MTQLQQQNAFLAGYTDGIYGKRRRKSIKKLDALEKQYTLGWNQGVNERLRRQHG